MSLANRWGLLPFLIVAICGCGPETYEVEYTDYKQPPPADDGLADDTLEEKKPAFTAALQDRRPLEGWQVNQSAAVIRLDVPLVTAEQDLQILFPSYSRALQQAERDWKGQYPLLPSVNLIDGIAKQFDDGLYAAIDLAWFQGEKDQLESHQKLVERLLEKEGPTGIAAPYLAAGLTLGGRPTSAADQAARDKWISDFEGNPALSKPIGFYTWNDELKKCWRFMRFFQQSLREDSREARAMASLLAANPDLRADYDKHARFFAQLTNPLSRLSFSDLAGIDATSPAAIAELRRTKGIREQGVAFFPPSTSRETELFQKLFPRGVPQGANLMKELVAAIRSGKVDLTPKPDSGWYDHQVFALETLLLPSKAEETEKLLLMKSYKKRMLEAFQALITKRRETHVRQLEIATAKSEAGPPPRPKSFAPRLRLEPCPTFYVRTARSYAFLENLLIAAMGKPLLESLHGRKEDGARPLHLAAELAAKKDLFYGLYLVACDDIGLAPKLDPAEVSDLDGCHHRAAAWLGQVASEPDLASDTRVAVPISVDPQRQTTRLWVTLGVRLTKLHASYARPPSIKPATGEGDWELMKPQELEGARCLIAVDEFAEVEIATLSPPTREELRKLCDTHRTKEKILEALRAGKW